MVERTIRISQISNVIQAVEATATRLVLIDGLGGAGKSILAEALAAEFGVSIVQGDDFYRPSVERQQSGSEPGAIGAPFDWRRLELQVLVPLSRGEDARYQRYDWDSDRLGGWSTVPCRDTVIVEGVYLLRNELRRYASVSIWVGGAPRGAPGPRDRAKRRGGTLALGRRVGCGPRTPTCLPCGRMLPRCSSLTGQRRTGIDPRRSVVVLDARPPFGGLLNAS